MTIDDKQMHKKALESGSVAYRDTGRYWVVDAVQGQGAFLAFDVSGA